MNECQYRLPCGICLRTRMECLKNNQVNVIYQTDIVTVVGVDNKIDTATSIGSPVMVEGENNETIKRML